MGSKELHFEPCPLISHPHPQTYFSSISCWIPEPKSVSQLVSVSHGDKVVMEVTTPKNWTETSPTVLCVHGLCGSHASSYLLRLVNRLEPLGIKTVRFNMRGCGSGKGLARQIYHSGRSEDVFEAVKVLKSEFPSSPIILIGFSLGGNIVLKLMGELGSLGGRYIDRVIAVSPPVDLMATSNRIHHAADGMYERYFYRRLRKDVHELHKKFKDLPPVKLPRNLKLLDFDAVYTVPRIGYPNVFEYYTRCSSIHYVEEISTRCQILWSEDDPIVDHNSLDRCVLPSNIMVYKTKYGGHMGYLANPSSERGFFWLDSILVEWITDS